MLIFLALVLLRKASHKSTMRILYIAAIVEPTLEIFRIAWLWSVGETQIVKLLPLHLCTMQMIFIPLAVFFRWQTVREFTFFSSLLGGMIAILSPAGVADTYPFFHFQTLQTLGVHALLIFIPLALLLFDGFYPSIKNMPRFFLLAACAVLPAVAVDAIFKENYMFLCTPPPETFMVPLYDAVGQLGYQLFLVGTIALLVIALYALFEYGRKKGLQKFLHRV